MNKNMKRRSFLKKSAIMLSTISIVPRGVLGGKNVFGAPYTAPSDQIQMALIGCGKQGRVLSKKFIDTKKAKIIALSEVYESKATLLNNVVKKYFDEHPDKGNYNSIPNTKDYREILERKDIDAVIIATPDHWHAAQVVNAAISGKDIYCEKPLALTVKEGRAMVNAARQYNRIFQTGSMQRSQPEFRKTVELIRNGYLGDIIHAKVNIGPPPIKFDLPKQPTPKDLDWKFWLGPNGKFTHYNEELAPPPDKDIYPNWRNYKEFGGGKVTDWGAHMFDIIQWALNMDLNGPTEVTPPGYEGNPYLQYRYKNGTRVTHEKWDWENAIHFIGTEGELKIKRKELWTSNPSLMTKEFGPNDERVYFSEDHYLDFLNAMASRKYPIADVAIGQSTSAMCNIGNICYELKSPLKWDPIAETFDDNHAANKLLGRKMNKKFGIKI